MELELIEQNLQQFRLNEEQNLNTINDLTVQVETLDKENFEVTKNFDPEKIRLLEEKISQMNLEQKSLEELFDKLIDGYGGSSVGTIVRE